MKQQGDTRDFEKLAWNDKCKILQSNPVTVARMFDNRFHTFLQKVTLSTSEPIGKVIYYFYRIEFKRRGSTHTYCLFCLENPQSSEKITKFHINTKTKNYIILWTVEQNSENHVKRKEPFADSISKDHPHPTVKSFISKP